jgi:tetratricopeptide (TPR) repeat protein
MKRLQNLLWVSCRSSKAALVMLVTVAFGSPAFATSDAEETSDSIEVSSADLAGPELPHDPGNESVQFYNQAISLYNDAMYEDALATMRAAMRARRFSEPNVGLAYSNLCLMYLRVEKFANATAACNRALLILPNYVPAVLNLARAENRQGPP